VFTLPGCPCPPTVSAAYNIIRPYPKRPPLTAALGKECQQYQYLFSPIKEMIEANGTIILA